MGRELARDDAWRSPPQAGDEALRVSLGTLLGCAAEDVIVSTGVRAACAVLADAVREAVVESPTFADIPAVLRTHGVRVRLCPWEEMPRLRPGRDRRMWWVTDHGRNPDGACLPAATRAFLADRAAAGELVVRNTVYRWEGPGEAIDGAVEVGSLAKVVGGGARLGWIVAPEPHRTFVAWHNVAGPPRAWQRAWATLLGPEFDRHAALTAHNGRRAVEAYLTRARPIARPTVPAPLGSRMLVALPDHVHEDGAIEALAAVDVRVSPGRSFLSPRPAVRLALTAVPAAAAARAADLVGATLARLAGADDVAAQPLRPGLD